MLVQDGKTGFIGFGTLPETAGNSFGYVPKSIIGNEEDEHDIDPELRMLMRKMSKKDTITRLKVFPFLFVYNFVNVNFESEEGDHIA